jgi:hypothetical protein
VALDLQSTDEDERCGMSREAPEPRAAREPRAAPALPPARGPLSAWVLARLQGQTTGWPPAVDDVTDEEALRGDDLHLALYILYELHYRSFAAVPDQLEWDLTLLGVRASLEAAFEAALRRAVPSRAANADDVAERLDALLSEHEGWSLSSHMARRGTVAQMREFAIHRSAYQLKEADPHTWVLPRLDGEAKAAAAAIQFDEYGSGERADVHSALFADTLRALGLDDTYGIYLPRLPGATLATVNLISMFGLHRRLRGALVGHLAAFEMTSVVPMRRYSAALARLGFGAGARRFYDVHVEADAVHQCIARDRLVTELARAEPELGPEILLGAGSVTLVEDAFATQMRDAWTRGESSLLRALDRAA